MVIGAWEAKATRVVRDDPGTLGRQAMAAGKVVATTGRAIKTLEIAGWGGGPGWTPAIILKGTMSVSVDPMFPGLVRVTVLANMEIEDIHVARRLVHEPKERLLNDHRYPGRAVYLIPKGTAFSLAPEHIRLMVEM
jgi:hypothetical protein